MVDSQMRFATCATPAHCEHHVMSRRLRVEQSQAGHQQPPTCDADLVVACCSHNTYIRTAGISSCDCPLLVLSSKALQVASHLPRTSRARYLRGGKALR